MLSAWVCFCCRLGAAERFAPSTQHPPCLLLTHGAKLPSICVQLTQLPRLERLRLEYCSFVSESLSHLSALAGSLTRLETLLVRDIPTAGLAALTRLQHLRWSVHDGAAVQSVAGALPHLTGLTCLVSWGHRQ